MFSLFHKKKEETPPAAVPPGSGEIKVDDEAIQVMPQTVAGTLSTSLKPHETPAAVVPAPAPQPVIKTVIPSDPSRLGLAETEAKGSPSGIDHPATLPAGRQALLAKEGGSPPLTKGRQGGVLDIKNFDRRILWVLGGVVLLLVITVVMLLLWPQKAPAPSVVTTLLPIMVPPQPPSGQPLPTGQAGLAEAVLSPPPQPLAEVWVFPVNIKSSPLSLGEDQDKDELSDSEEALFKTNPALADTDRDSYLDGLEVVNLYSPRRGRKARIWATADVSTFTWSPGKAKFIYPAGLRVETKDEMVRLTSATGKSFSLQFFPLEPFTNLEEWVKEKAPQVFGVWRQENYKGQESWWSPDGATALLSFGEQVYLWHYNTGERTQADFAATFKLLVRSTQFKVN